MPGQSDRLGRESEGPRKVTCREATNTSALTMNLPRSSHRGTLAKRSLNQVITTTFIKKKRKKKACNQTPYFTVFSLVFFEAGFNVYKSVNG